MVYSDIGQVCPSKSGGSGSVVYLKQGHALSLTVSLEIIRGIGQKMKLGGGQFIVVDLIPGIIVVRVGRCRNGGCKQRGMEAEEMCHSENKRYTETLMHELEFFGS